MNAIIRTLLTLMESEYTMESAPLSHALSLVFHSLASFFSKPPKCRSQFVTCHLSLIIACSFPYLLQSMPIFSCGQVVKAQLQEQKFLQRMLEDRGESVKGIEATAAELVKAASPEDREQVPS